MFLLAKQYQNALASFEMASASIKSSPTSLEELDFLVTFGKAIALDNLGFERECSEVIVSLSNILAEEEEGGEAEGWEEMFDPQALEDLQFLRVLANLSRSNHVRSSLYAVVDELEEGLTSETITSDSRRLTNMLEMNLWKKAGKKIKKCAKGFRKFLKWIRDVLDDIADIQEQLEKVKAQEMRNSQDNYYRDSWQKSTFTNPSLHQDPWKR